jgi:hypothetical protein
LPLVFEAEGAHLALLGVEYEIFKIALLAESTSNILEVVRTLQVVPLQEPVGSY